MRAGYGTSQPVSSEVPLTLPAKQMLETGSLAIEAIGYEDPNFFRRLFKRATGITPARYRQRFSRIAMAGSDQ